MYFGDHWIYKSRASQAQAEVLLHWADVWSGVMVLNSPSTAAHKRAVINTNNKTSSDASAEQEWNGEP